MPCYGVLEEFGFDMIKDHCWDPMHTLFLGVAATYTSLIFQKIPNGVIIFHAFHTLD